MAGNPTLYDAVQKANKTSVPNDNIDRAIKRGAGIGGEAISYESIMYEAYGPAGVAFLVECLTDNKNRAAAEVRTLLSRNGGTLADPGSVAYNFDKKGVVAVDGERYSEDDLMVAIDAGAEDISFEDDVFEIVTEPSDLTAVRKALDEADIEIQNAEVLQRPKALVPVDEDTAAKLIRLIDNLEDNDDVDAVHANFDVDAEVLERLMAA